MAESVVPSLTVFCPACGQLKNIPLKKDGEFMRGKILTYWYDITGKPVSGVGYEVACEKCWKVFGFSLKSDGIEVYLPQH